MQKYRVGPLLGAAYAMCWPFFYSFSTAEEVNIFENLINKLFSPVLYSVVPIAMAYDYFGELDTLGGTITCWTANTFVWAGLGLATEKLVRSLRKSKSGLEEKIKLEKEK